jgi:hypothetical protein
MDTNEAKRSPSGNEVTNLKKATGAITLVILVPVNSEWLTGSLSRGERFESLKHWNLLTLHQ